MHRFQELSINSFRSYTSVYGARFTEMRKGWVKPAHFNGPRNTTGATDVFRKVKAPEWAARKDNQPSAVQAPPATQTANEDTVNVQHLMTHFSKILTKHGIRGEEILARVSSSLRHRYHHPNPVALAIDAIKPVLKYQKFKNAKSFVPVVLHPKPSVGIAVRWLVELAGKRTYLGNRPSIQRGLVDEIDAIIQGNSSLYARRSQFHKNPN